MLENLEREYQFLTEKCAFYSRPDEVRVINFCKPHVAVQLCDTGFSTISHMQQHLRDKETLQRQKNRERKIRSRLSGLNPLPWRIGCGVRYCLPTSFTITGKGKKLSVAYAVPAVRKSN